MAVSKRDPKRKEKLNIYKQKTKKRMSEQNKPTPPKQLRSFPIWKSQDKIDVTGLEWEKMYNALNIFREAIVASESVMQRNAASGVITTKFIDENDQEVSPEEVEKYTKELQAYFAAQAAEQAKTDTPAGMPSTSPILTETGETQAPTTPAKKSKENKLTAV